ncbi:hypothetical protein PybrP1_007726 [[Pythium] brassicae (nom. inval.)]|nr:hypothetical protein PybrP1_007726 [[Pythium] brassicae (nom. inval.)]
MLALSSPTLSNAFKIHASGIAAPSSDLGRFQSLEKTWHVSGPSGVRSLLVATPAIVFVEYDSSVRSDSSDVAAKVVVTGDSEELIKALDVVPWNKHGDDGIELRFHSDKREFRGHLLMKILVGDKQALRTIKSMMSGDVVVTDDVLAANDSDANIELTVFGSGDVQVFSKQKLAVATLAVSSFASGDIEVQAPVIDAATDILVTAFASGDVAVVAGDIRTEHVFTKTGASGDVYLQADNLVADTIDTLVAGSGDVTLSRNGKCANQTARLTASGDYYAGSIVSEYADISVISSGDALVQVTEQLTATIMASGEIHYVNAQPKELLVHARRSHGGRRSRKTAKQASHNSFDTFTPSEIPSQSPELIVVGSHGGEWIFSDDDDSVVVVTGGNDQWTSNLAAALPSSVREGVSAPVVFGIVGAVMGVAGVAAVARKYLRPQTNRAEFSRLV